VIDSLSIKTMHTASRFNQIEKIKCFWEVYAASP